MTNYLVLGEKYGAKLNIEKLILEIEEQFINNNVVYEKDGLEKGLFIKPLIGSEVSLKHLPIEIAVIFGIKSKEELDEYYLKGVQQQKKEINNLRRKIQSAQTGLSRYLRKNSGLAGSFYLGIKDERYEKGESGEYGIFYRGPVRNLQCPKCKEKFYQDIYQDKEYFITCHNNDCRGNEDVYNYIPKGFILINQREKELALS
ncbi:hypothetical protein [Priestia aryabhattai]